MVPCPQPSDISHVHLFLHSFTGHGLPECPSLVLCRIPGKRRQVLDGGLKPVPPTQLSPRDPLCPRHCIGNWDAGPKPIYSPRVSPTVPSAKRLQEQRVTPAYVGNITGSEDRGCGSRHSARGGDGHLSGKSCPAAGQVSAGYLFFLSSHYPPLPLSSGDKPKILPSWLSNPPGVLPQSENPAILPSRLPTNPRGSDWS